ncbi:glycosyltransferase family 2 protein [Methanosarcina sp. DH1]|uniref:glycosyltransferase family 2 protein n=1 Tax=Methanosarcina sp. DH1 TaxID=2605695 RepID=UPI001E51A4DA|nr:glycosyltransferase family 2 protein [Methanosarcina sp. DH1]
MKPKISVIIPLLNKGPHIRQALKSALNQTVRDFEIIVVDGGSTDNGPDVVRSFSDNRIIFFKQKGTGVSAARNQGVEASKADLIAFLDADDEWKPQHLETILKLKDRYPYAGAYTTAYKIKEENGRLRWAKYKAIPPEPWEGLIPNYFKSGALGEYPVWTSVVCIPRNIFNEIGGFPEKVWYGEDADIFGKIALKYPIAFSWYMGGIYHYDAVNRACNRQTPLEEEPFVKTAKKAIKENLVPPDKVEDLNEYIAIKEIYRAGKHLSAGKKEVAMQILKGHKTKYHRYTKLTFMIATAIPSPIFQRILKIRRLLKHRMSFNKLKYYNS